MDICQENTSLEGRIYFMLSFFSVIQLLKGVVLLRSLYKLEVTTLSPVCSAQARRNIHQKTKSVPNTHFFTFSVI